MKKTFEERKKIVLDLMKDQYYVPMKEKELAVILQVEPEDRGELSAILQELILDKKIQISKRGKYMLFDEKIKNKEVAGTEDEALIGTFISNQKGFGFVEIDGLEDDLFIPESKVNGAFHLDTVRVALVPNSKGKRQEAEVIGIIERGTTQIVGTYQKNQNFGFVVPDNHKFSSDIFVTNERSKGAVDGHKVVVELTDYGKEGKNPEGKVIEILGHINDPGVDIMSIVKGFGLPTDFPEKVMNQAEKIPETILDSDRAGREDLRDVMMVTIDGEDAKDLDDAVSLTMEGDNYCLGVHIADVSNYVQENSALDREALLRGTSVYLVDRVIPMLPHKLSNGICSLNQGQDRLALSCIMTIDPNGKVIDYRVVESVICVDRRMTYTSVNKIIEENDEAEREKYKEFVPMFEQMATLASILRKNRKKRGSIDFDFPETKMILDSEGHPIEIKPYERNSATKLIEDFMLIANETVAQYFYWLELPFVYRTHDNPDSEKIMKLATFIHNFGYTIKMSKDEIHPKEIQKLLANIEGKTEEDLISRLALRSMKQAKYTIDCSGHFGLACRYYCHFTSPIRRYPDLQIHRIIKDYLRGRMKEERKAHYEAILADVAAQSSKMERRADEAERETEKMKKAEYMGNHLGETFEGIISGIMEWGIYVELPNTVEGMIHVSKIPGDYFVYDEIQYEMVGSKTGIKYKLGQPVNVIVDSVDKQLRTIDFSLLVEEE